MRVIKLIAENFKKLKAVQIVPTENIIMLTGANEQGKSSILDAIWAAIGNADMVKSTGTTRPIRDGEKKASVCVDLGEMIVTRKWTESGSIVSIESKDGKATYRKPQEILDGLMGKIALDPLSFATMDGKKQTEILIKLANISINLEDTKKYRQGVFDKRTEVNRSIKHYESQLVGLPEIPKDTPDNELLSSEIISKMEKAQIEIRENDKVRASINTINSEISLSQNNIVALKNQLDDIEKQVADLRVKYKAINATIPEKEKHLASIILSLESKKKEIDAIIDPDISGFKTDLERVEVVNKNVGIKKQQTEIIKNIEAKRAEAETLSKKIDEIDNEKDTMLKTAKFPIENLGFDDDGITYKAIPFAQCSSAERLRVSIAIAMAMSPKLRVIRITDGSLIDSKNMSIIEEMCKEKDYQCWIEKVDESGKIGIYIEDGEIKPFINEDAIAATKEEIL